VVLCPVVDSSRVMLGIITDRDIYVALGTRDLRHSELGAEKVMSHEVATGRAVDEIHAALKIMRTRESPAATGRQ
jgi:CBS domain-containing protein